MRNNQNFIDFEESQIIKMYQEEAKKSRDYFDLRSEISEKDLILLDEVFSHPLYRWDFRDYPRAISLLDFNSWINKYSIRPKNLAYTYGEDPELKIIESDNYINLEYDPIKKSGDLHTLDESKKYDFFLFNQTLEHLYNPFVCVKNIHKSLVSGGYVFTSVPTINIPHSTPIHFNGFTPMGLFMLFKTCGFNIIETGQWGNLEYIKKMFSTHTWPGYKDLNPHGLKNEEENVVSCWILAKKI
jgi:hypothetical protein